MTQPVTPGGFHPPGNAAPPAAPPYPPALAPYVHPVAAPGLPLPQQPPPWAPNSVHPPQRSHATTIAVIALVVGAVAFLTAAGAVVAMIVASGAFSSYDLTGTAPQVVEGQPYSGEQLAAEVQRVIEADGGTVDGLTCPQTAHVDYDATTVCTGTVDGFSEHVTVDFQDGEGHFVLTEQQD